MSFKSGILKEVALLILLLFPMMLAGIIIIAVGLPEEYIIYSDFITTTIGGFLGIVYLNTQGIDIRKYRIISWPDVSIILILLVVQLCWSLISNQFFIFLFPSNETGTLDGGVFDALSTILIAPVFEEIIFRFGMITLGKKFTNLYMASGISIVLFTIAHIGDTATMISTFGAATLFAYIYTKTGNLIYVISAHMLNNMIAVARGYFKAMDNIFTVTSYQELLNPFFVCSIIFIGVFGILLIKKTKNFKNRV